MTGSTKYASQDIAFCSICDNPIPLEITATDENGEAVHEDCYASQTISQFRKSLYLTQRLASPEAFGSHIQIILF